MFCPKCSQLQSSEEMRFCSRCGFQLAGVAMLLENDGAIPQLAAAPGKPLPITRKKLMAESVLLTALSWSVAFIGMLFSDVGGPLGDVATIAGVLFFLLGMIGLLRFLYGFLFKKDRVAPFETSVLPGKSAQLVWPNHHCVARYRVSEVFLLRITYRE